MVVSLEQLPINYRSPKELATDLFNLWEIGNARENIGILFLLVISERRLEIEIGTKLNNFFTDNWLQDMQYNVMIPHFKEGKFSKGTKEGLIAIKKYFRLHANKLTKVINGDSYSFSKKSNSSSNSNSSESSDSDHFHISTVILILIIAKIFQIIITPEKCEICNCNVENQTIEDFDLNYIQILEKNLGNCWFSKIYCKNCDKTTIRRKIINHYGECSKCNKYTNYKDEITLSPATYSSTGEMLVINTCSFCAHSTEYKRGIPMKVKGSSSSYSSSGGGSSGGGSGSSW